MKEFIEALEKAIELAPDWIKKDRVIKLLADQELVANWDIHEGLKVKKVRCNQCGECCLDLPDDYLPFGTNGEGKCNKLKEENGKFICTAGHAKPFTCLGDPHVSDLEELGCCIRYFDG